MSDDTRKTPYGEESTSGDSPSPETFTVRTSLGSKRPVSKTLGGGATKPPEGPVCTTCNDTHQMWLDDLERYVMCTRCPTPCRQCGGLGAYCKQIPCSCDCHASAESKPPEGLPEKWHQKWRDTGDDRCSTNAHYTRELLTDLAAANRRAEEAEKLWGEKVAELETEISHKRNRIAELWQELTKERERAEEREADMHMRTRAGYDATVADAWRTKVAELEQELAEERGRAEEAGRDLAHHILDRTCLGPEEERIVGRCGACGPCCEDARIAELEQEVVRERRRANEAERSSKELYDCFETVAADRERIRGERDRLERALGYRKKLAQLSRNYIHEQTGLKNSGQLIRRVRELERLVREALHHVPADAQGWTQEVLSVLRAALAGETAHDDANREERGDDE